MSLFRHSNITYNKRNNRVPSWKKAPVCQTCTKHMRGVAKMLEYKQKRNNGRTPFAGVYKFVCVCFGFFRGHDQRYVLWVVLQSCNCFDLT